MQSKTKEMKYIINSGRWYVDYRGVIYPGDMNGKFPYCVETRHTQTVDDIVGEHPVITMHFVLINNPNLNPKCFTMDSKNNLLNTNGDVLSFCEYLYHTDPTENTIGKMFYRMKATFGGRIF